MPETPEHQFQRAGGALRMPAVDEWATFPFDGEMRPRVLRPPLPVDPPRTGLGGVDCQACSATDQGCVWTSERWRLRPLDGPHGLPVILLLVPRIHCAEPGDLPDEMARELGALIARIERAIRAVPHVGRVHVCRWGDGGEHLHWWFMARPARFEQLIGSFAAVWDDILPPTPAEIWDENLAIVARELAART
jgi:diadenosine tetraphosphate (Ap4A) HIT family hydrolase